MKYSRLPNTDIEVSRICLGTMTFGEQNTLEQGHKQIDYALDNGVNFIDTAEAYSVPMRLETYGRTEEIIGEWFKRYKKREKVILASKIVGPSEYTSNNIRNTDYKKEAIQEALENSLKRLQTDYIDLYQLHWPVREGNFFGKRGYQHNPSDKWKDDFHEILETLEEYIKSGKIRCIGISNETSWGVMRFLEEHKLHNLPKISTIQNPYSLLNRSFEEGLAEISIRENVGLLAYSPMAFGVLSGKYLKGAKPNNSRITLFPNLARYSSETSTKATERYYKLAKDFNLSLAQFSLAFVNTRPFLTSNIIGATTIEQLKENIDSINVVWTQQMQEAIDKVNNEISNPAP